MSFQNVKIVGMGCSAESYHHGKGERGKPDFRVSPSMLKTFFKSPSKWIRGYSLPDSDSKEWGNLVDVQLLTPERFKLEYAIHPDKYESIVMRCPVCGTDTDSKTCREHKITRVETKIEKDWNAGETSCKKWIADQGGKTTISNAKLGESLKALQRIADDEILAAFHNASDKQVHVVGEWLDEATGLVIPVECLIDYAPKHDSEFPHSLGDLKTTTNAAHRPFLKWAWGAGYHVQGAFDLDMFNSATGQERSTWCFVLSENYPPYEPGRRFLDQNHIESGRAFYRSALAKYARCLATNTWPGYDDGKETSGGWTMMIAEPWMAFEAQSDAMQTMQEEAQEQQQNDSDDLIP